MKNISIRITTEEDKQSIMELWKYSFADTEAFVDYYFDKRFEPKHTIALLRKNDLEAALQLNPYNLAVGDVVTEARYVVGVSVQPESRGQGYMTALIKETLNMQYAHGDDFSILMPIDTKIYTRYGYANCFMRHEFHADLERLAARKTKYKTRRLNLTQIENMDRELHILSEVYFDAVSQKYSFIVRNRTYWKNKLSELAVDSGEMFIVSDEFSVKGYAMLLPKSDTGTLQVVEMVALDKEAFNTIMGLIKGHSTQAKRAVIVTPQAEELNVYTEYDNHIQHIVKPFMMGRIINADVILDRIIYKSKIFDTKCAEGSVDSFQIEIQDHLIEENNFTAVYRKGQMSEIIKEPCDTDCYGKKLKLSVAELAQLYLKSTTVSILHRMGKVEVKESDIDLFKRIFGNTIRENYINDFI